ncbi:MAG: DUF192 domain-containing protein [Candidatus Pacebacteria bacterium]|nr:DUF192 domain-containing protein [Candidatus Paceibacterota bacterium]
MATSRTISAITWIVVIGASFFVLAYLARQGIASKTVLPLNEYIAEKGLFASSTGLFADADSASGALLASSTDVGITFGGNKSTSTPLIRADKEILTKFRAPQGIIYSHVARTPSTRERGLSGTLSLDSDEGMLFIFPQPGVYAFWMKDMNFAIDIVWIDSDRRVIGVTRNVLPETYPETFGPTGKVQFVLEAPSGSAEKFGLKEGSIVSF